MPKETGTITLPPGDVHHGDTLVFEVEATVPEPWVTLVVFQDGVPVLTQTSGYFDGYGPGRAFVLSNNAWAEGAADGHADLHYTEGKKKVVLDTVDFPILA